VRRALALALLSSSLFTTSCETVQEVVGVCVAVPVIAICGAGIAAGACSRCIGGPPPAADDEAAARGEQPLRAPGGVMAMGY
jgi:hypothetical protein